MEQEEARFLFFVYVSLNSQLYGAQSPESYGILKIQQETVLRKLQEQGFVVNFAGTIWKRSGEDDMEIPADLTFKLLREGVQIASDTIRVDFSKMRSYQQRRFRAENLFREFLALLAELSPIPGVQLQRTKAIEAELERLDFAIRRIAKDSGDELPMSVGLFFADQEMPVCQGRISQLPENDIASKEELLQSLPNSKEALKIFRRFISLMTRAVSEKIDSNIEGVALEEVRDRNFEELRDLGWEVISHLTFEVESLLHGNRVPLTLSFALLPIERKDSQPVHAEYLTVELTKEEFQNLWNELKKNVPAQPSGKIKILLSKKENDEFLKLIGLQPKEDQTP